MKRQQPPEKKQFEDLLYQALETEMGGVEIYRMAILCARNEDLKDEWTKYLAQTQRHVEVVRRCWTLWASIRKPRRRAG